MERAPPSKRPRYDAAFRAEALRLQRKLLYAWQKAAQLPLPTDPAEAAGVRALRTANKRLAQELDILKKAIAICQMLEAHFRIPRPRKPAAFY